MQNPSLARFVTSAYDWLHWLQSSRKSAAPLIGISAVLLVVVVRHFLFHAFELVHFSALAIAFVLLLPEIFARLSDIPEFAAKVFVRRTSVISVIVAASLAFAALLMVAYRPWMQVTFTGLSAMVFLLQGALVGAFIRIFFVTYLKQALRGVSTHAVETMLLVAVAVYLFLFPTSEEHDIFAAPYLAGVAIGFVVHFVIRGFEQRSAKESRMRQNIIARLGGAEGPKLQRRESDAVDYYARQDWPSLRELFRKNTARMTTPLVIVQASMERFHGNHEKALNLVDIELEHCGPASELTTYLLLLRALCLGEVGADALKIFDALDLVLVKNSQCVLGKATWAIRAAELVPLTVSNGASESRRLRRAYVQIRQAVRLAEKEDPNIWALAVGTTVPVTWTFLFDAYAYVVMRNGCRKLSKALLEHCISVDPKFAAPYVHLGEWYLLLSLDPAIDDDYITRTKKVARLCFCIAIELEGRRDSLIKRRARTLLAQSSK